MHCEFYRYGNGTSTWAIFPNYLVRRDEVEGSGYCSAPGSGFVSLSNKDQFDSCHRQLNEKCDEALGLSCNG